MDNKSGSKRDSMRRKDYKRADSKDSSRGRDDYKRADSKESSRGRDDYKKTNNKDSGRRRNDYDRADNRGNSGRRRNDYNRADNRGNSRRRNDYRRTDNVNINDNKYLYESQDSEYEDSGKIEGKNTVFEALSAERQINRVYLDKDSKDQALARIYAIAREKGIVVSYLDKSKLDTMSETRNHQGVIAEVAPYAYVEVEDILKRAEDMCQPPFMFILDGITDPNNLGSIIRTAECAGVHGIILPKRRSVGLTAVVAKVAAGAAEHMPIARVTNLSRTIQELKDTGLWIAGADMAGDTDYVKYDYKSPLAVVIGSEGEGISRLVRENCDIHLSIPMYGKINSLNAAVAAALIAFRAAEQRNGV